MDTHRGWRAIDGGIVTALAHAEYKEYCHNPTLVQHIGHKSTMGNSAHPQATSFQGEQFDAMKLLDKLPPLAEEPEPLQGLLTLGPDGLAERAIRSVHMEPIEVEKWLGPCSTCNDFQTKLTKLSWWINERMQGRASRPELMAIMEL
jgi:hypothetical protein